MYKEFGNAIDKSVRESEIVNYRVKKVCILFTLTFTVKLIVDI